MLERLERPVKIICLGLAVLLACQLGYLLVRGDPLAHLKIPALPALPGGTNDAAQNAQKVTNTPTAKISGTNGTNVVIGTNSAIGTNLANGTNGVAKSTNTSSTTGTDATSANPGPKPGNSPKPGPHGAMPGLPPEMMAQMMGGGGMPGGPNGGGIKKVELPAEVQSRVDRIIDSEVFGPIPHPMPMSLLGIADQEAFIQATNGQIGPVKIGGELGGIKLLRIGINRVLVELGGEKKELTLFGGIGGESLMPDPANAPSTNMAATNSLATNAPARKVSSRNAEATNALTSQTLSLK
jgi:hypothetical protein